MNEHPAAALFPLMDDVALAALADDIRAHGLRDPIETLNGELLDGRNRLRACDLAGVTPRFVEATLNGESPTEYVVSRNLHRRHLTTAQRAALAVDLLPHLEDEARQRQYEGQVKGGHARHDPASVQDRTQADAGRSDAKAAEIVGVGRSTVAHAKAIQKRAPDVIDRMRAGEIRTVGAAAREAGFTSRAQSTDTPIGGGVKDVRGREHPAVYYGRGDKFNEATEPIRRYLRAWAKQDYAFPHVNPREARRRLAVLDDLAHGIEQVRRDLESRSQTARLTL